MLVNSPSLFGLAPSLGFPPEVTVAQPIVATARLRNGPGCLANIAVATTFAAASGQQPLLDTAALVIILQLFRALRKGMISSFFLLSLIRRLRG